MSDPVSAERDVVAKFADLQALRSIAASLVVVDHSLLAIARNGSLGSAIERLAMHMGLLGVEIFFIISGFIMMHTSASRFGSPQASRTFLWKRAIRIVPVYWLATSIAFAQSTSNSLGEFIKSLFFVPFVQAGAVFPLPVLQQGWTLNYEVLFYLLFAICLCAPRRIGLALIVAALGGAVAGGVVLRHFGLARTPLGDFYTNPILLLFVLGIALQMVGASRVAAGIPRRLSLIVLMILATLGSLWAFRAAYPPAGVVKVALWLPCLLIVLLALAPGASSSRSLEKVAVAAGDASYSTYLFHPFVIALLTTVITPDADNAFMFVAAALIASNLLGYLVFTIVERPLGRWGRNRSGVSDPNQGDGRHSRSIASASRAGVRLG